MSEGLTQKTAAEATPDGKEVVVAKKPGNLLVAITLGLVGTSVVAGLTILMFFPGPYPLGKLDQFLDKKVRYSEKVAKKENWREALVEEQQLWLDSVNKLKFGHPDARPEAMKRDMLLFLADSYFRDPTKPEQARSTYMVALVEPVMPHKDAYNLDDALILERMALCSVALREPQEAEGYFLRALKFNSAREAKAMKDPLVKDASNRLQDELAYLYLKNSQFDKNKARQIVKDRLSKLGLSDIQNCVEIGLLNNVALLALSDGDLKLARRAFELALNVLSKEGIAAGVVPNQSGDNDRRLAKLLIDYATLLRKEHKSEEAFQAMERAYFILDQPG